MRFFAMEPVDPIALWLLRSEPNVVIYPCVMGTPRRAAPPPKSVGSVHMGLRC